MENIKNPIQSTVMTGVMAALRALSLHISLCAAYLLKKSLLDY